MSPEGSEIKEVMATLLVEFHEGHFQLSQLCEVCFVIFDSKCVMPVFQRMSVSRTGITLLLLAVTFLV